MDLNDATQKMKSLDSDKPVSFQYLYYITLFPTRLTTSQVLERKINK